MRISIYKLLETAKVSFIEFDGKEIKNFKVLFISFKFWEVSFELISMLELYTSLGRLASTTLQAPDWIFRGKFKTFAQFYILAIILA
jgi:hypothetical protein